MQAEATVDRAYPRRSPYLAWMEKEGIPIAEAMGGLDDVTQLPREPWARMGGKGTFIQLRGAAEAQRGIYVAEIPGGGALNPEKHLYDEAIYVLQGRGLAEVWTDGDTKRTFEWGEGSVFSPPLNAWHRLINGSREPAIFLAITRAPRVMNLFNNFDFVFNCDYKFMDRYSGQDDYFQARETRQMEGRFKAVTWYTNFISDVKTAFLDDLEQKVSGGQLTSFSMAGGFPHGHISEWSVGKYHKAHYHPAGAILVGISGQGYVLLWPHSVGIHPYQDGHADEVVKVAWGPKSIYAPPDDWCHQHFSTGKVPARHLAFHAEGNLTYGRSFTTADGEASIYVSVREGGVLIEYEDEDPQIRRDFEEELRRNGVECHMPQVTFRRD